jgi:hypothetical protein
MATLNEVKIIALKAAGAVGGTINELEIDWLKSVRGRAGGTLNELWVEEFIALGAAVAKWNGMAYEYLGLNGAFQKKLNERWYEFWTSSGGGSLPSLISNTDAVAALWTERGANTVVDAIPAEAVEITNVDNDGGCYLRLSTATILSEALVDGLAYTITFTSKTSGLFYLGLASDAGNRIMTAGRQGVDFKPLGSTDLAATFLNISLPSGVGQVEAIDWDIRVWKNNPL